MLSNVIKWIAISVAIAVILVITTIKAITHLILMMCKGVDRIIDDLFNWMYEK